MKYLGQPQSGSQANITASHNRAGQYLRSRRKPVVPTSTPKQGAVRQLFAQASAAWQGLSSELQAAWIAFAASYPVTDALGQAITLTGQQYFIGIQTSLMNAGQDMNTDVPTNTHIGAVDAPFVYADTASIVIVGVSSLETGDFNLAGLSQILSNGVNFNKAFSQFAVLESNKLVADVSNDYVAENGAPLTGKKIFARFKVVNSSGMSGPELIIQTPVSAPLGLDAPLASSPTGGTLTVTCGAVDGSLAYIFEEETGLAVGFAVVNAGSASYGFEGGGKNYYARVKVGAGWSVKSNSVAVQNT
jgi:hypothetical protein